jgi:glutathione S-transferase
VSDLRLYDYAASANCYKVRLLLAHLALPYERVATDIFAGETLTDEYAAMNPMRTTPVLQTPNGFLPESNAILLYLAEGTRFLPDDPFERAQVVRWLIYERAGRAAARLRERPRALSVERRRRRGALAVRLTGAIGYTLPGEQERSWAWVSFAFSRGSRSGCSSWATGRRSSSAGSAAAARRGRARPSSRSGCGPGAGTR